MSSKAWLQPEKSGRLQKHLRMGNGHNMASQQHTVCSHDSLDQDTHSRTHIAEQKYQDKYSRTHIAGQNWQDKGGRLGKRSLEVARQERRANLDDSIAHVGQRDLAIPIHIQCLQSLRNFFWRHEELQIHGHNEVPVHDHARLTDALKPVHIRAIVSLRLSFISSIFHRKTKEKGNAHCRQFDKCDHNVHSSSLFLVQLCMYLKPWMLCNNCHSKWHAQCAMS